MSKVLSTIIRAVLPVLVLVGGWFSYKTIGERPDPPQRPPEKDRGQLVETVTIREATDGLVIDTDGLVIPDRMVTLSAEVSGRITDEFKTKKGETPAVGRFVEKDEPLFAIDPEVYATAVDAAQAEFDQAKSTLDQVDSVERKNLNLLIENAESRREITRRDLARAEELKRNNSTTLAVVESAKRNELQATNELRQLENELRLVNAKEERLAAALEVARARLKSAQRDKKRSTVLAPATGIIVEDNVEVNAYVQTGATLLVIEDTTFVEVRSYLTLEQMAWLWRDERAKSDQDVDPTDDATPAERLARTHGVDYELPPIPVTISFDLAGRTYEWDAHFCRYDGLGLDERTRTVPCRINVPEPREVRVDGTTARAGHGPRALMRGMYVDVRAEVHPTTPLLCIPERAVKPGGHVWRMVKSQPTPAPASVDDPRYEIGKTYVFVVEGRTDGTVWGTGDYTADSSIATAAVHAGLLEAGATGPVRVEVVAGREEYEGATANGVTSSAFGPYTKSFRLERDGPVLDVVAIDVAYRQPGSVYVTRENTRLAPGDRLVTSPLSNPEPGVKLRAADDEEPAKTETKDAEQ